MEGASLWGTTGLYHWHLWLELAFPKSQPWFLCFRNYSDPFAWGFTDSFLSLALADPRTSRSQADQGEEICVIYSQHSFMDHLLCASPCARDWGYRKNKTTSPPWINSSPNGENLEASGSYIPVWQVLYWGDIQDVMEGENIVSYSHPCAFREDFLEVETSELDPKDSHCQVFSTIPCNW